MRHRAGAVARWEYFGGAIALLGILDFCYSAIAWRDTPAITYTVDTAAGIGLGLRHPYGCALLAVAAVGLLLIGIHNAWDITLWSVTHAREQ
jgi:hypothetical protein